MLVRTLVAAVLLLLAVPAVASASPEQIFEDCQDGRLDRGYEPQDYREALRDMPGDLDEYTNCRELIRSAQRGSRGSGGAGPGGGFGENAGTYGALPTGGGGLPLGPDSQPIDPTGIASEEERRDLNLARTTPPTAEPQPAAGDPADARLAAARPDHESGAALPSSLVALLSLCAAGLIILPARRLKDLVLRRSS